MTTTHKPATPLPWTEIAVKSTWPCEQKDLEFILHAANSYPQLVAALRVSANVLGANGGPTKVEREEQRDELRALLRSLGEDA